MAKSAIRTVWRELIADVKRCPRQVVEDHPWGVVLGFASTGAVIGAVGAARRQRAKRAKSAVEPEESPGVANGRAPREQVATGRSQFFDVALRELGRVLMHVAPAFLLGLREGNRATEDSDDTGVVS